MMATEPIRSVPVDEKDPSHRVQPQVKNNLLTRPKDGASTLYEIAKKSFEDHIDEVCMRQREFIGWKSKKVKEFSKTAVKEWKFSKVEEITTKFGAALRANGCVPSDQTTRLEKIQKPCRIAIFENTCPEWMLSCIGAFSQSIGVVTVYATLGIDSVVEAVNDNILPVMVCNKKDVHYLVENAKKMPTLKTIVYTNDLVGKDDDIELPEAPTGVKIFSFDEFVESGDPSKFPITPPTPDTTAVIMYTSGSTGKPKGVVIKHCSVVGAAASAEYVLGLDSSHRYIAFLPLAHILELIIEFVGIANGVSLNYADPKSLTATGSYPIGALEYYRPTHMVGVPKIWDTIKKGIMSQVDSSSPIAQVLVHTALEWRTFATKIGLDTPLFNLLVFKKFKNAVGGHLQYAISGGGPLNAKVQEFIRTAFDFPLIQGYGLTETCAAVAIAGQDDERPDVAGIPLACVEVKLVSTPDICDKGGLPYLSTDRKDVEGNPIWGRGEVWARGINVTSGYYMMPDETKKVFKEGGWFATGDIGQFLIDGSIRLVDRKKNLVKLKSGEYVALERMESVYAHSPFVDALAGGICCYADGDMDRPVALVQLSESVVMNWAQESGISGDIEKLKESKELNDAVMKSFHEEHANSDLSRIEKLKACTLLTEHWTIENGCLTAANKLQRRAVIDKFSKEFEEVREKGVF
eukprot:scaffold10345_cov158-Cylindrotheca_fusiformis.AAC.11